MGDEVNEITRTPLDDAPPDDESRIEVEVGMLVDIEAAEQLDTTVEVLS